MDLATHGLGHHHRRIRPYAHAHIRGMDALIPPVQNPWPWRHQRTLNSIFCPALHGPSHHHGRLRPPVHTRGMATLGLRHHHCHYRTYGLGHPLRPSVTQGPHLRPVNSLLHFGARDNRSSPQPRHAAGAHHGAGQRTRLERIELGPSKVA